MIFAGINYYKLRDKYQQNSDIIVFLVPFILNVILFLFSLLLPSMSSLIFIHYLILYFQQSLCSLLVENLKISEYLG